MGGIAERLWQARLAGTTLPAAEVEAEARDLEQAYQLQSAQLDLAGEDVVGVKLGATNATAQALMGLTAPFFGRLFASAIHQTNTDVPVFAAHDAKLECEFAVRLGADLPGRETAYSSDEAAAAIASVAPSFELTGHRTAGAPEGSGLRVIADGAVNQAIVLGAYVSDWRAPDLAAQTIRLRINGEDAAEGSVAAAFWADLGEAVAWAANHRVAKPRGLKAGDIVMTGTVTPAPAVKAGDVATADFGAFGTVETRLTDRI